MPGPSTKPSIFISYAHDDQPEQATADKVQWLSFVIGYLQPAASQGLADVWFDNRLRGGDDWDAEINHKLWACDVFVLLVSRHALASKYILDTEIAVIKERQKNREEVHCYPLLLTTTPGYALDPVRGWNIRPKELKPFDTYPRNKRAQQMADAADEVIKIAKEIANRKPKGAEPAQRPPPPPETAAGLTEVRLTPGGPRTARQPRNLPFFTLGNLFVGREAALYALRVARR